MVSLSNYCIWCLFLFISNFMKSSTVYSSSLYTFVRVETVIWPSIRFDISLQNFKKPLDIYILTANRKKTFRRIFSHKFCFRKKTLSGFLASSSSFTLTIAGMFHINILTYESCRQTSLKIYLNASKTLFSDAPS